jgi:serine/threonine protein kinase
MLIWRGMSEEHRTIPGPEADPLIGTVLAERYRIERRLGEGGMGAVYLARHVILEKIVALKILHAEYARRRELVERFLHEAKAASRIRHQHVIDITDFGETADKNVFFAMEYLEGQDLAMVLDKENALPWPRVKNISLQLCAALQAAHEAGVIHRDLKPENIYLIDRFGNTDFVKVLDFGVAKLTELEEGGRERRLTRTGMVFGTPEYMSPEQARGEKPDPRVDVYAAGCILFEMLTGDVPFRGDNFMGVLSKHLFEPAPKIKDRSDRSDLPAGLEDVLAQAMAKDKNERFGSMNELAVAIDTLDGTEGIRYHATGTVASTGRGSGVGPLPSAPRGSNVGPLPSPPRAGELKSVERAMTSPSVPPSKPLPKPKGPPADEEIDADTTVRRMPASTVRAISEAAAAKAVASDALDDVLPRRSMRGPIAVAAVVVAIGAAAVIYVTRPRPPVAAPTAPTAPSTAPAPTVTPAVTPPAPSPTVPAATTPPATAPPPTVTPAVTPPAPSPTAPAATPPAPAAAAAPDAHVAEAAATPDAAPAPPREPAAAAPEPAPVATPATRPPPPKHHPPRRSPPPAPPVVGKEQPPTPVVTPTPPPTTPEPTDSGLPKSDLKDPFRRK